MVLARGYTGSRSTKKVYQGVIARVCERWLIVSYFWFEGWCLGRDIFRFEKALAVLGSAIGFGS